VETEVGPPDANLPPLRVPVQRGPRSEDAHGSTSDVENGPAAGRKPLHWLLEGVLIVVSVLLAFSLTELGEYRNERELAARVLATTRAELEYNRAALAPFIPIHRAWSETLEREDPASGTGGAIDVLFATRPKLPPEIRTNVPLLRRTAWDTALSTGALRLIDYDVAAGLSEIYGMQDYAGAGFPKLFSDPSFFDASGRSATIKLAQTTMRELIFAEESLLALYDKHLPAIRGGAGGE
jgi:hypothetical protein